MSELIRDRERLLEIRAKLNAVLQPFANRPEFEAANIPAEVTTVYAFDGGVLRQLVRDVAGTWVSGDGATWTATIAATFTEAQLQDLVDAAAQSETNAALSATAAAGSAADADDAADRAAAYSASAGVASGRLVAATYAEFTTKYGTSAGRITPAVGDIVQVVAIGAAYERVASGGHITIDGLQWLVRNIVATPEMFGATGGANDSAAIALWWQYGATGFLVAKGTYTMAAGTVPLLTLPAGRSLSVEATGASFTVTAGQAHAFRVLTNAGCSVRIRGMRINGSNVASNGILVDAADGTCETISITGCEVSNIFGLVAGYWSSSCSGIRVSATAKTLEIKGNSVSSVNRAYVNPGVVASQGIGVAEALSVVEISGNWINDIQSPAGDADADGIVVFSRDVQLDTPQEVAIRVHSNYLRECKGRFVKLQTTEAYVFQNRFDSITKDIIPSFRAVDAQFGGCRIENNYWHLRNVGGASSTDDVYFANIQARATARAERRSVVADNYILLERNIRYLVFISTNTAASGVLAVETRDNFVQGSASAWIHDTLIRQSGSTANFSSLRIEAVHNTYVSRRDAIINLDPTFATDATVAAKSSFHICDNANTVTPTAISNMVFLVSPGVPHIGDICIRGNSTPTTAEINRLNAQSLPLAGIRSGSEFYYGTDGSTGGITTAPAGYNRFVNVQAIGSGLRLSTTAADEIHRVSAASGWRRIATVAFP